jgi:hypothetical protein
MLPEVTMMDFMPPTAAAPVPLDYAGLDPYLVAGVLGQRVIDAERTVAALTLSDVRVTVSSYCPRGCIADHRDDIVDRRTRSTGSTSAVRKSNADDEVLVRPRILPAVKVASPSGSGRLHNGYHALKSGMYFR